MDVFTNHVQSPWTNTQTSAWQAPSTGIPSVQQLQQIAPRVHLHISCSRLINLERTHLKRNSNPMVVCFVPGPSGKPDQWMNRGHTEVIDNESDPRFVKGFEFDYYFALVQPLRFEVYDIVHHSDRNNLARQHFIGQYETRLSELVTAKDRSATRNLVHPQHSDRRNGAITITVEEQRRDLDPTIQYNTRDKYIFAEQRSLYLAFSGRDLQGHALIGKGDPFFVLSERPADAAATAPWSPVHKSAMTKSTHNPYWEAFTISLRTLNNGDPQRPLRVEVYDHKLSGKHELVGMFETTTAQLAKPGNEFALIHPGLQIKKRHYVNSGYFVVREARESVDKKRILNPYYCYTPHTFIDFMSNGLKLKLNVAIDFTSSNGRHSSPSSLHYFHRNRSKFNEYEQAIMSVGKILLDYDSDKQVPVFGFGGHPIGSSAVSHCFNLNRRSDPRVNGIDGILNVYHKSFDHFELSGPTHFAEVIRHVANTAKSSFSSHDWNYQVLLIITDGEINDMAATTREIVHASNLPLTIVIVGVGPAEFENMRILESEGAPLTWSGQEEVRDIVEFVPFERVRSNPQRLAELTLSKLPYDVTSYMALNSIQLAAPSSFSSWTQQSSYQLNASGQAPTISPFASQQQLPTSSNGDSGPSLSLSSSSSSSQPFYAPPQQMTPPGSFSLSQQGSSFQPQPPGSSSSQQQYPQQQQIYPVQQPSPPQTTSFPAQPWQQPAYPYSSWQSQQPSQQPQYQPELRSQQFQQPQSAGSVYSLQPGYFLNNNNNNNNRVLLLR